MPFQFNAGKVGGMHVGVVGSADELAGKIEMLDASDSEKQAVMNKFAKAETEYTAKKGKQEKKPGVSNTLFDAIKKM